MEFFARKQIIRAELSRKILHLFAVSIAAFSPFLVNSSVLLILTAAAAVLITFYFVKNDILISVHEGYRKSWGILFFPLAYFTLLILWSGTDKWVITASLLIAAFSDSFAAVIGGMMNWRVYRLTSDRKSFSGSITFFITTIAVILLLFLEPFRIINLFEVSFLLNSYLIVAALSIAMILTFFEAISSMGFDNFSVPVAASLLLFIFFDSPNPELLNNFILGIFLSGIVAYLSFKVGFLTANGSAATFLLAGFIFGFGGWQWSIPIMAFFILSSILSKVRKKVNSDVEQFFEKSGTRDYLQVLANGGLGGILVIINQIYPAEILYFFYCASLAAVCADTWATEIGTMKKAKTYFILNFKEAQQGISGGVSIQGTLGALLGALVIALSGIAWTSMNPWIFISIIATAGVLGSFFDSVLGATIQAQNQCNVCDKITEKSDHCGEKALHVRGYSWMNNDAVNFFSGLVGGILILVVGTII